MAETSHQTAKAASVCRFRHGLIKHLEYPQVRHLAYIEAQETETPAPLKWEDYKAKAKEELGLTRIKQSHVEKWMKDKGIS